MPIPALLAAAPYVIAALSGLGHHKNQQLTPEQYAQKYGALAQSKEIQELMNYIMASPYGMSLIGRAAASGQQFANSVAGQAASANLAGPGSDATTGAGVFATGAAEQAQNAAEGAAKEGIFEKVLPVAVGNVQQRAALDIANRNWQTAQPTGFEKLGAAAGAMAPGWAGLGSAPKAPGESMAEPQGYDEFVKSLGRSGL